MIQNNNNDSQNQSEMTLMTKAMNNLAEQINDYIFQTYHIPRFQQQVTCNIPGRDELNKKLDKIITLLEELNNKQ